MTIEKRDIAGLGIVLVTVIISVAGYPRLPEEMAIHFDASGDPDGFAARWLMLVAMPALTAGVVALFKILPAIDPLGENFEQFAFYYDLTAVLTAGIVAYSHLIVVLWNLDVSFDIVQALAPVVGALIFVLGYVIENVRQNWFIGIRTPWTLSNEEIWDRTHQRSGVLFKLAGLVVLLAVPFPEYFVYFVAVPLGIAALLPTVYSFVLYRRFQNERVS